MSGTIPDHGDVVWLNFDPHLGHEQAGRRPALILSHSYYNRRTGMLVCCPITSKIKHHPFEVVIPAGLRVSGAVLSDQIRCVDYAARDLIFIYTIPNEVTLEVLAKVNSLIGPELT